MRPEELNIPKEKFVLVNENKKLKDKELVTKPVGFFMDAMHRFAKNKGSIVGAIVIAILVLYSLIVPLFSQYNVSYRDTYYRFTLPKLFNAEHIDFLDGCAKKTVNETTFLYYYSMGVETGHNAVKRQDYKVHEKHNDLQGDFRMYTYREDSYHKAGTVFLTGVSVDQYQDIQAYQDEKGVQIIYPITDLAKRPEATQNTKNANYWFETVTEGSISVPSNYTFNEDGTVTFKDIYSPYKDGSLVSSSSGTNACKMRLIAKDGGYALCFYTEEHIVDEETEEEEVIVHQEYLKCYYFHDADITVCVDELEDASVFNFDSAHGVLTTYIDGHENSAEDGNYFFALYSTSGSSAFLVNESEINNSDYCPFVLYSNLNNVVTVPEVNKDYYFGTVRNASTSKYYYFAGLNTGIGSNSFNSANVSRDAAQFTLVSDGASGYYINVGSGKIASYLAASVDGDKNVFSTVGAKGSASSFSYDSALNTLKISLTGHTDTSLDGDYVFCLNYQSSSNYLVDMMLVSAIDPANNIFPLVLFENGTTEASSIAVNTKYYLCSKQTAITPTKYFANGEFDGDNYTSKMRIEGNDTYKYAYARPTNGTYELRVNYYEYYIYYHQHILKDRITQPYFLFGTTANGQDIFTCLASGARFSFVLAIIVASVNLFVGAIYGALEGYYGGKIDLIMERIVEILSAVPFMIVITLLKYHMGGTSHAVILFISFFLTGWIGMSGLVRMQFYRFKNQEYVLASRTLGARDLRIMFKHIFPNALGTIVTSCVLVIPSMIFSETSLSYLGIINLNSGSMTSVGTLLANAQPYLVSFPHMILFPAIFISLLMLCFNLFGNGLRDAFNPSLRGTED